MRLRGNIISVYLKLFLPEKNVIIRRLNSYLFNNSFDTLCLDYRNKSIVKKQMSDAYFKNYRK